jgi:peptidoglycan/xylan/chitin deacetylase (PgdA/CDA1 family)
VAEPAPQRPPVIVTTSWDDGHVKDESLAELLHDRGLAGTFYIAPRNVELPEASRLGTRGLRALSDEFEIGGHTLTHLRLPALSRADAKREIRDGKAVLEDVLGSPVDSFCYPGGAYSEGHPIMVAEAGFSGARTVDRWVTTPSSRYELGTTVHAYRHWVDHRRVLALARGNVHLATRWFLNWEELAIALFDRVAAHGGVYHLWGHSWEVDARGDWQRLRRVLSHISGRAGVEYLTNGQLFQRVVQA